MIWFALKTCWAHLPKTRYPFAKPALTAALSLLLCACVSLLPPANHPITEVDLADGYYTPATETHSKHRIILSFSGGGMRAAALSYGVLQELRDTYFMDEDKPIRLLDQVNYISAVSGGSFTAAYYGLHGDNIFNDYEDRFLYQNVQSALIKRLFRPDFWFKSLFSGFDRTELAIDYYERTLFHDATFHDMRIKKRPFIEIQSTDIAISNSFSFTQDNFDVLCSNLNEFSVARAVTASSAVPILFPAVTLKNYGNCDNTTSPKVQKLQQYKNSGCKNSDDPLSANSHLKSMLNYLDAKQYRYLQLVDGGVADNLGAATILARIESANIQQIAALANPPKSILLILVNAAVTPDNTISQSPFSPGITQTALALSRDMTSSQTLVIRKRIYDQVQKLNISLKENGTDLPIYLVEVSFDGFATAPLRRYFNNLPTSLGLPAADVNNLINAGRVLLRSAPSYQQFLSEQHAVPIAEKFGDATKHIKPTPD